MVNDGPNNGPIELAEPISCEIAGGKLKNMMGIVPIFAGFPVSMIEQLQKAASVVTIDPESTILKQGDLNNNLYFLVLGTVEVYVDGGLVAALRRKGDLLGEMSVITSKPCSATIIAKTPVELICIDVLQFKKVLGDNTEQYDHILYRIYSQILTDKVNITNQRAKRVESMLDALERAKNELQDINSQMERRVVERTQALQSGLQELMNVHLQKLSVSLKSAESKVAKEIKPLLVDGLSQVDNVVRFLEPLVQRFNLEVSMKNKRVLLAQAERKSQTISKMALGGTGVAIDTGMNYDESLKKIIDEKYDIIMVDSGTLALVDTIQKLPSKPKVVYVDTKGIKDGLLKLEGFRALPSIVILREEDRAGCIRNIMTTLSKLTGPNIFGLEKYLNLGVDVRELKVENSQQRQGLIQKMKNHFSSLGIRGSILDTAGIVLEEMLMNAIYDAPTDASGQFKYNQLPRTTLVELKPNEQSLLRFATDGTLLAVSVQDPFGSLSADIILNYLRSCYSGQEGTMQHGKGGAGRGMHQIIENSTFVVFNVHPQRHTEVIAFFDVVPGPKEELAPMLHYFIQS
jgi:CRP-like cAMP-binding protein